MEGLLFLESIFWAKTVEKEVFRKPFTALGDFPPTTKTKLAPPPLLPPHFLPCGTSLRSAPPPRPIPVVRDEVEEHLAERAERFVQLLVHGQAELAAVEDGVGGQVGVEGFAGEGEWGGDCGDIGGI